MPEQNIGSLNINFTASDKNVQVVIDTIIKKIEKIQAGINKNVNKPIDKMTKTQILAQEQIKRSQNNTARVVEVNNKRIKVAQERLKRQTIMTSNTIQKANTATSKSVNSVGSSFKKLSRIGNFLVFNYVGRQLLQLTKSIFTLGSDMAEIENVFQVSFRNMAGEAEAYAKHINKAWGVSETTIKEQTAVLNNMFRAMKFGQKTSMDMSQSMTQLSYELSSLWNISQKDAFEKIKSAMIGMPRPIRELGILTDETTIKQVALQNGIIETSRDLTQQEKVLARYYAILEQSKSAWASTTKVVNGQTIAVGDFSKTLMQPQNQLRLLGNQLADLGRYWGLAFMPIVQVVLPVLNALVNMLINAGKAFATFMAQLFGVGDSWKDIIGDWSSEKLPQTGMGDLTEDAENLGGAVGGATDKVKELKKQLAGIDEINNLTLPSDSSGGGGGGGVSAPDFGEIEWDVPTLPLPDIVKKWADGVQEVLADIFKPLVDSWNKYSGSILINATQTFNNLAHIIKGTIDVISKNWNLFFGSLTSLFFNLVDTITIAMNGLSKVFRSAWDSGGKYLLDSIMKLISSLANLANAILSEFIKPVVKFFTNYLAEPIGKAIGLILKSVANLINILTSFFNLLSSNTRVLKVFAATLGAIYVGKLIKDFTTFNKYVTTTTALAGTLSKNFGKLGSAIGGVIQFMTTLITKGMNPALTMFPKLNTLLGKVSGGMTVFANGIGGALTKLGGLTSNIPIVGSALTKLGGILSATSFGPWGAAIGIATTALGALAIGMLDFGNKTDIGLEKVNKALEKMGSKIEESKRKVNELTKSTQETLSSIPKEYAVQEKYLNDLISMTGGKNGYVENIGKAKLMAEELNKVVADSVTVTEDGYVIWQKTPNEIQKVIDKLKEKLEIEAYEEQYKEAIKETAKLRREEAKAIQNQKNAQKEYNDAFNKFIQNTRYANMSLEEQKKIFEGQSGMKQYVETLDKANKQLSTAKGNLEANKVQLNALDKIYEATNGNLKARGELIANEVINNRGLNTSYNDLRNGMTLLQEKIKETTGVEKEENQAAFDYLIGLYAKKMANSKSHFDKLYQDMVRYGVNFNSEQKRQLEQEYHNARANDTNIRILKGKHYNELKTLLNQYGIDMESIQGRQYQSAYEVALSRGKVAGQGYINNLKNGLASGSIVPEVSNQTWQGQNFLNNHPLAINAYANNWQGVINNAINSIVVPSVGLALDIFKKGSSSAGINISRRASGGIAYGTSIVEVAEYANAGNNPEIIAPLSDLNSIMESTYQKMFMKFGGNANNAKEQNNDIAHFTMNLDGKPFYEAMVKEDRRTKRNTGKSGFSY